MSQPQATDPRPAGAGATAIDGLGGFRVERWIAAADDRAVAIGVLDGDRVLVAALPLAPDAGDGWARPGREAWDLPLVALRTLDGGLTGVVEALPRGEPSTGAPRDPAADGGIGPFAAELARRVAEAHRAGEVVGRLHPALVFVSPKGSLAGVSQRPLVAPLAPRSEGRTPLWATGFVTPGDVRGAAGSQADDVFRLAAMAWAWRHGEPPFGSGVDEAAGVMASVPIAAAG